MRIKLLAICLSVLVLAPAGARAQARGGGAALYSRKDFHFGPGTATVYTRAAPNTTSRLFACRLFALNPAHHLRR